MAIHKAMLAALKALSSVDLNVKKTYLAKRKLGNMRSKLYLRSPLFHPYDQNVILGDHVIPVRVFRPRKVTPKGILFFFHGGGWVTGNIDTYNRVCVMMAQQTAHIVISVDYRLAPENPFPIGLEDCYETVRKIVCGSGASSAVRTVNLIGDSAGGNLAAAVSLMAKDRGDFQVDRQILIYPVMGSDHSDTSPFPSVQENGTQYLLTAKRICDFMDLYIPLEEDRKNPYFSPLLAKDLSGQPKTLVITAEFCLLRDEGEAYGARLRESGNDVTIVRIQDALHGFFSLPIRFKQVKETYGHINRFLEEGRL